MTTSTSAATESPTRQSATRATDELRTQMRETIRRTVRALATYHDLRAESMAAMFEVSKATAYRKLNGDSDYTSVELGMLAYAFACNVSDFYTGIVTSPSMRPVDPAEQIFNDPGITDLEHRRMGPFADQAAERNDLRSSAGIRQRHLTVVRAAESPTAESGPTPRADADVPLVRSPTRLSCSQTVA